MINIIFNLIRPLNVSIGICSVLIIFNSFSLNKTLFLTLLVVGCFIASSNIINDLFDQKTDKINKRKKIHSEQIIYVYTYLILLLMIGILASLQLNINSQIISLFIVLPLIFLYTPIFKGIPFLGNFIVSLLVALVFVYAEVSIFDNVKISILPFLESLLVSINPNIHIASLFSWLITIDMRLELKQMQRDLGITFIHVTHSQEEALALATVGVVMNHGRIEQCASPINLFNKPSNEFVADFVGGHNIIKVGKDSFCLRADKLKLSRIPIDAETCDTVYRIADIEFLGSAVNLVVQAPRQPKLKAKVTDRQFYKNSYEVGQQVCCEWAECDLHKLEA